MRSVTPSIRNSQRRGSRPHDPVYRTGAVLGRATSAFQMWQCHSNGARIRTPCDSFGGCLLSQEHTAVKAADLLVEAGSSRHFYSASSTFQ